MSDSNIMAAETNPAQLRVEQSKQAWRNLGRQIASVTPKQAGRLLLGLGAVGAVVWVVVASWPALLPFLVGAVIAYTMLPLVNRLDRVLPRFLAALIGVIIPLAGIAALIYVIVPPLVTQFLRLIDALPDQQQVQAITAGLAADARFGQLPAMIQQQLLAMVTTALTRVREGAEGIVPSLLGGQPIVTAVNTFSTILGLLVLPTWLLVLLKDQPRAWPTVAGVFPPGMRRDVRAYIRIVDNAFGTFLRVTSLTETRSLTGHSEWVLSVDFSPDGRSLLTGGKDKTVRVWDPESGSQLAELIGHAIWVRRVRFLKDGTAISADRDGSVLLWDVARRRLVRRLPVRHEADLISADVWRAGRQIVTGSEDGRAKVYTCAGVPSPVMWRCPASWVLGGDSPLCLFASASDRMVAAAVQDRVYLWRRRPWDLARSDLQRYRNISDVFLAPNRCELFIAGDHEHVRGAVFKVDCRSLEPVVTYQVKSVRLSRVTVSPSGGRLLAGGEDGSIHLFQTEPPRHLATLQPAGHGYAQHVEFSADGRWLGAGIYGCGAKVWSARDLSQVYAVETLCDGPAFSPDGQTMAIAGKDPTVRLWDTAQWKQSAELVGHRASARAVTFSRDNQLIASADEAGDVKLWDRRLHHEIATFPAGMHLASLHFTSDSRALIATTLDSQGDESAAECKLFIWSADRDDPAAPPMGAE